MIRIAKTFLKKQLTISNLRYRTIKTTFNNKDYIKDTEHKKDVDKKKDAQEFLSSCCCVAYENENLLSSVDK